MTKLNVNFFYTSHGGFCSLVPIYGSVCARRRIFSGFVARSQDLFTVDQSHFKVSHFPSPIPQFSPQTP